MRHIIDRKEGRRSGYLPFFSDQFCDPPGVCSTGQCRISCPPGQGSGQGCPRVGMLLTSAYQRSLYLPKEKGCRLIQGAGEHMVYARNRRIHPVAGIRKSGQRLLSGKYRGIQVCSFPPLRHEASAADDERHPLGRRFRNNISQ